MIRGCAVMGLTQQERGNALTVQAKNPLTHYLYVECEKLQPPSDCRGESVYKSQGYQVDRFGGIPPNNKPSRTQVPLKSKTQISFPIISTPEIKAHVEFDLHRLV